MCSEEQFLTCQNKKFITLKLSVHRRRVGRSDRSTLNVNKSKFEFALSVWLKIFTKVAPLRIFLDSLPLKIRRLVQHVNNNTQLFKSFMSADCRSPRKSRVRDSGSTETP